MSTCVSETGKVKCEDLKDCFSNKLYEVGRYKENTL